MKKILFTMLALVLMVGLALPMAAVVGAASTATFGDDPYDWEKTENRLIDDTSDGLADAPAWTDAAWGTWITPAWDGPSNGIYGDAISYWVEDDTWVMWNHTGIDWEQHTDQWFRTTVDIPATWSVTSAELLYKYNEAIIPINDDLYVYVDDKYVAAGGTAGVPDIQALVGAAPPNPTYGSNTFVAAVDPYDFAVAPETGWYLSGGLDLPPELFTPGSHDIHVLGEEFDISGGLGHLVIQVEYEEANPSIEITKEADRTHAYEGDTINYLYRVHNDGDVPLGPVVVTDSLPITPTPLLPDGVHNRGDLNKNGKLDPCETWYFTASYTVPDPCARTVIPNTGTAVAGTGLPAPTRVSAESNEVRVIILHPCIELEKWTIEEPPAYYNGTEITYYYGVHNCGDTPLDILVVRDTTLGEDATEVLGSGGEYNRGDLNNNGVFEPCETWYFSLNHTLECPADNITWSDFCNTAMAGAFEPILESRIVVRDTWKVRIFQWLPRSKGYWGNWDNHWSDTEMTTLIRYVNFQSDYFGFSGDGDPYSITKDDVHDLLLEKMKGKMDTDKAEKMLAKQLLAAWLSVKSYEGATDGNAATPGSLEAAMNPNATVYINGVADGTVEELLHRIENAIGSLDVEGLLLAKDILEKMNTAESNNYEMFMDPDFDPTSPCR